jgi:hypothetical protein
MDKIIKIKIKIKRFIIVLPIIIIVTLLLTSCKSNDLYDSLLTYCRTHEEVKLSDITSFEWDISYVDRQYYGAGEEVKEKYQIEGNFQTLETDFSSRIAFCKNGKLVYDLILNNSYLYVDTSIEIIKPNTVLLIEREKYPGYSDTLKLKESDYKGD